jgi:putative transcriptional regulator
MQTKSYLLIFIGMLLLSWQPVLHALPPEKIPSAPVLASSSFLLVANKQMPDERFRKTVLLVTRHGNSGPIGIVVNRPQDITLDKVFPEIPEANKFSLFYGGPVYPKQVSYLVRGGDAIRGALTISKNVYLASDMLLLGELLRGKRHYSDLRVMYGLASWAPGQMEHEIGLGAWFVVPLDAAAIFELAPEKMWQEMYNRANRITI